MAFVIDGQRNAGRARARKWLFQTKSRITDGTHEVAWGKSAGNLVLIGNVKFQEKSEFEM